MSEIKMISKKKRRNRKRKKIILASVIAIIVIAVIITGIIAARYLNNELASDNKNNNNSTAVQSAEEVLKNDDANKKEVEVKEYKQPEEVLNNTESNSNDESLTAEVPTQDNLNIGDIAGFTSEADNSLQLPYKVPNTPFVIESIGSYNGPFVEDGTNNPVENIVSMVVKNDADVMAQYGEIKLKINDSQEVLFKLTNLPAKTSALVIESTGAVQFASGSKYVYENSMYAAVNEEVSLMEDKLKIGTDDNRIIIKNNSEENLGTVYVYYKYVHEGGVYLGGITFRTKFENVTAGAQLEQKAVHFSKDKSSIMMVSSIPDGE